MPQWRIANSRAHRDQQTRANLHSGPRAHEYAHYYRNARRFWRDANTCSDGDLDFSSDADTHSYAKSHFHVHT